MSPIDNAVKCTDTDEFPGPSARKVESSPKKGSKFTVTLPANPDPSFWAQEAVFISEKTRIDSAVSYEYRF